jgi:hypothetical protein
MAGGTLARSKKYFLPRLRIARRLRVERRRVQRPDPPGNKVEIAFRQWESRHSTIRAVLNKVGDLRFRAAPQPAVVGQGRRAIAARAAFAMTTRTDLTELLLGPLKIDSSRRLRRGSKDGGVNQNNCAKPNSHRWNGILALSS